MEPGNYGEKPSWKNFLLGVSLRASQNVDLFCFQCVSSLKKDMKQMWTGIIIIIIIIIIILIIIIVIKKVRQLRNSPCFSCAACSLSDTWPFASNCLCYRTTNHGTCLAIGAIKPLTKKNQNNQMAPPPSPGGRRFPLASFRKEVSIKLHLPSSVWCPDSAQAPASEKWRGRLGVVAMAWDMTWVLYRWIFHETKHPATGVHPLMETLIWLGLMWVKQ